MLGLRGAVDTKPAATPSTIMMLRTCILKLQEDTVGKSVDSVDSLTKERYVEFIMYTDSLTSVQRLTL